MNEETLKKANSLFEIIKSIRKEVKELEYTVTEVKNGPKKMGNVINIYGVMFPVDDEVGISLLNTRIKERNEELQVLEEELKSL